MTIIIFIFYMCAYFLITGCFNISIRSLLAVFKDMDTFYIEL